MLDCVGNPIGMFVNLGKLSTLDQKPDLWFGAGISQQNPSFAAKFALDFIAQLYHFMKLVNRGLRFHFEISLGLRVFLQTCLELAQRFARFMHDSEDLKCADNTVTGRAEFSKDNMAALFAAEIEILLQHFFNHITIANLCPDYLAA